MRRFLVLAAFLVAAGCVAPAPRPPMLGIANGTTMALRVVAGGWLVADVAPGASVELPLSALPALPWDVEAMSSTGRVVLSMHVEADDPQAGAGPDGMIVSSGVFARADLSCGRLDLWFGSDRPGGPVPDPDAGQPGDCGP